MARKKGSTQNEGKPKSIVLKNLPDDVWEKMNMEKATIMINNPRRGNISHQSIIYKLIKNSCE